MRTLILSYSLVAIFGLGAWLMWGLESPPADVADIEASKPETLGGADEVTDFVPTLPDEASQDLVTAQEVTPATVGDAENPTPLSDLEKEIMQVLANAHAIPDTYPRADAEIEAKLDIQVRAALERKAITPREVPEYRDYLRQLAIQDKDQNPESLNDAVATGIFADQSFVTEE